MEITALIELYGLPGLIIGGLAWAYRSERIERREAQRNEVEALRQVIPAVAALESAVAALEAAAQRAERSAR